MTLELPIYFHTDETQQAHDLELPYSMEDCETRMVTFYEINAVSVYQSKNGSEYALIHANGDKFISTLSYAEVNARIARAKSVI